MLWWGIASAVLATNVLWLAWRRQWLHSEYLPAARSAWLFPGIGAVAGGGAMIVVALQSEPGPQLASAVAVASLAIVSARIDAASFRLPLVMSLILAVELVVLTAITPTALLSGLLGALLWGLPLLAGWKWGRQVGKGDVIMGPLCGLWLGGHSVALAIVGLVLANVALVVFIIVRGLRGPAPRGLKVPFGPFLVGGAVMAWGLHGVGTGPHLREVCEKMFLC